MYGFLVIPVTKPIPFSCKQPLPKSRKTKDHCVLCNRTQIRDP